MNVTILCRNGRTCTSSRYQAISVLSCTMSMSQRAVVSIKMYRLVSFLHALDWWRAHWTSDLLKVFMTSENWPQSVNWVLKQYHNNNWPPHCIPICHNVFFRGFVSCSDFDKINMHMSTCANHTNIWVATQTLLSCRNLSHKKGDTSLNSGFGGLLCLGGYCGNAKT